MWDCHRGVNFLAAVWGKRVCICACICICICEERESNIGNIWALVGGHKNNIWPQKGKGSHLFGGSIGEEGLYMCLYMYT